MHKSLPTAFAVGLLTLASACSSSSGSSATSTSMNMPMGSSLDSAGASSTTKADSGSDLPGMPAVSNRQDVYADAGVNMLSATVKNDKPMVYVPDTKDGDVWEIDPTTFQVVKKFHAGKEVQHVVPSWDLKTLYATDDLNDHVVPIDAATGQEGAQIPIVDPYNMYATPNGKYAISVAERMKKLVWYDPKTWQVKDTTQTPDCGGIDHADFSVDGKTAVFTCEFAGRVAVIDVQSHKLLRMVDMPTRNTHMGPQDIKLAPDGSVYYIADSDSNGVWVLDGSATKVLRHISTGMGSHGLYLSRDAKQLYVTNRMEGSVSVLNSLTGAIEAKWQIPGGGSPDMGNVTADGTQLWLSGRYNNVVYVISTKDGSLIKKIPVGDGPHGLCVWPQPGRYSLGHTGITR